MKILKIIYYTIFSYIFHEVRAPLNTIGLASQILLDDPITENLDPLCSYVDSIRCIQDAVKLTAEMLNDVMAIQKLEEGVLQLLLKPFTVSDLPDLLKRAFEHEITERNLRIMVDISKNMPLVVRGDKFRLTHALMGIFSNAVRFAPTLSTITFKIFATESAHDPETDDDGKWFYSSERNYGVDKYIFYRFTISDQGPGISDEKIKTLFTPFVTLRDGTRGKRCGSGVGLTVCKHIVMLHGGTILVNSKEGEGSKFSLVIPFERSDSEAAMEEYEASPAALVATFESSLQKVCPQASSDVLSGLDIQQESTEQADHNKSGAKEVMVPESPSKSITSKFKVLCVDGISMALF